jgi:hypothetical protein
LTGKRKRAAVNTRHKMLERHRDPKNPTATNLAVIGPAATNPKVIGPATTSRMLASQSMENKMLARAMPESMMPGTTKMLAMSVSTGLLAHQTGRMAHHHVSG